jgi:hypothetical protein
MRLPSSSPVIAIAGKIVVRYMFQTGMSSENQTASKKIARFQVLPIHPRSAPAQHAL